jgi:hypothetical protein
MTHVSPEGRVGGGHFADGNIHAAFFGRRFLFGDAFALAFGVLAFAVGAFGFIWVTCRPCPSDCAFPAIALPY